jgi:hypothetical protein
LKIKSLKIVEKIVVSTYGIIGCVEPSPKLKKNLTARGKDD